MNPQSVRLNGRADVRSHGQAVSDPGPCPVRNRACPRPVRDRDRNHHPIVARPQTCKNRCMMTKPAYLMTMEEIDRCYPKDCAERQQALKAREHSFAMYDFNGKLIPHPNSKENLLEIIGKRDTYVVDSNSDWKKECLAVENGKKAYIISPALARENTNTENLLLEATRSKLGNIFSVGIDANLNCILADRIDEHFRYVFNRLKLREASRGKGETVTKQKAEVWKGIEIEKQKIREILRGMLNRMTELGKLPIGTAFINSGQAADLPSNSETQVMADAFKLIIKQLQLKPESKYHVAKSQKLSHLCYATLLLEDKQERKDEGARFEFDCPQYEHIFGDMHIVQTAIYLSAKIMTKDKGLKQMAGYAAITCCDVPAAAPRIRAASSPKS